MAAALQEKFVCSRADLINAGFDDNSTEDRGRQASMTDVRLSIEAIDLKGVIISRRCPCRLFQVRSQTG
jgi:hypothetical protein